MKDYLEELPSIAAMFLKTKNIDWNEHVVDRVSKNLKVFGITPIKPKHLLGEDNFLALVKFPRKTNYLICLMEISTISIHISNKSYDGMAAGSYYREYTEEWIRYAIDKVGKDRLGYLEDLEQRLLEEQQDFIDIREASDEHTDTLDEEFDYYSDCNDVIAITENLLELVRERKAQILNPQKGVDDE